MVDGWSGGFGRPQTQWETVIYDDWLQAAQSSRPDELIQRFRRLYLDADGGYPNAEIQNALDKILRHDHCIDDFKYILNRTCYILINTWSGQPWHYDAIPSLIQQFQQLSDAPPHLGANRLHDLVRLFLQTPEYAALQKIGHVWEQRLNPSQIDDRTPIESLVYRYPFTYHQVFFGMSNAQGGDPMPRKVIQSMQMDAQRKFRADLSQYMAHRRTGRPASNPTLLADAQLDAALKQFRGKVYGNCTQRDFASHFLTSCRWVHSYREFKRDLYDYLKVGFPQYGDGRFLTQLGQRLSQIQPHHDGAALDESLIADTCQDLLYFLVLDRSGYHFTFTDLVMNVGPVATIGLVMKLVLLVYKQARFWVEQRFTGLFKHYATQSVADANWLVDSLETLNVGLSTTFPRGTAVAP